MEPARQLALRGWSLRVARVNGDGRVDLDALKVLRTTALVSVMLANHELGTLQPVHEVGNLTKRHGALFHSDAAQSMGKVPVNVDALGADLLTIAGHKMYAPKGIGALYVRRGTPLRPILFGAAQEGGLRAGTENVPYIVAPGAAAESIRLASPYAVPARLLFPPMEADGFIFVLGKTQAAAADLP